MHSGVTDFLLMQAKGLDKAKAVNTDWFYKTVCVYHASTSQDPESQSCDLEPHPQHHCGSINRTVYILHDQEKEG